MFYTGGHAIDLATIYKLNLWDTFNQWKKDMAKITPLYDFYYINDISTCDVNPDMKAFYDSAHNTHFTANLIIDKFIDGTGDYGRLNTTENIDAYIKQDTKNLKKWMKENPKWLKVIDEVKEISKQELEEEGE